MGELSNVGWKESFVASGDLSGAQFRFVQAAGIDVYMASSGFAEGVLQNKPQDNEHATVVVMGGTKILLASSLGPNIWVGCGSGGFAVQGLIGGGAGNDGLKYGRLIQGGTSGTAGVMYFTHVGCN